MATLKNLTVNDVGYMRIPQGTTAQRPTPSTGMIRYNTDNKINEVYTGTEWKPINNSVQTATGGTITGNIIGGYNVHTFTSPGTFTPTYSGSVEVVVVAGGGGGTGLAGGGGAGGYIYNASYTVAAGTAYPISIGTGGAGATGHTTNNQSSGNPSYFGGSGATGITATGGGAGTSYPAYTTLFPGGSGGGGSGARPGFYPGGDGITGQGHPGGWGHHQSGPGGGPGNQTAGAPAICMYGGGGGGGAGEQGFNRQGLYYEAKGGDGVASSITGTSVNWYAGGGAGGAHGPSGNYARDQAARSMGGGGGSYSGGPQGYMDATGYGSGGGSAFHPDSYRSGNGSSGIVIVRYRTS